jgi:hypothetical protein
MHFNTASSGSRNSMNSETEMSSWGKRVCSIDFGMTAVRLGRLDMIVARLPHAWNDYPTISYYNFFI